MDRIKYVIDAFGSAEITINEMQAEKYVKLCDLMVEYNKNVNLTAITDFEDVVMKHFIDSVLPFTMVEPDQGATFIDVGTGAGFPSLPLLIYRPDLKGTLCDSLKKRCVYLEEACSAVGISAEVIHARSEELGRVRREKYDIATARAVAAMPILSEYCIPFVKEGGSFIALKSVNEDIGAAKKSIAMLGGELSKVSDYSLPNGDSRRLVIVKKICPTSTKYPRNSSKISKSPL